jgi:hypothetical protein
MSRFSAASIGRCPALSFLLGPDGPAGAAPGQPLRSGGYMAAKKKRDRKDQFNQGVHAFRGTANLLILSLGLIFRAGGGVR